MHALLKVAIEYLKRVRHANRGRLLPRTSGPVPLLLSEWDWLLNATFNDISVIYVTQAY